MDLEPSERHSTRGLVGLSILALPIVLTVVVVIAYTGMFALGWTGRAGTTPTTVAFEGCPAAAETVRVRLEDMGYTAVAAAAPDGFAFTFDGPSDPAVQASLPVDLARPGHFEVRGDDEVLADGAELTEASVRLDAMMVPSTLGYLDPAATERVWTWVRDHREGALAYYLDGERIGGQANVAVTRGEIEIAPPIDDPQLRLRATAAWSVLIGHPPLPCPVSPRAP